MWAMSILRRMGYSKRWARSTSKVLPSDFVAIKQQYSDQWIVNWDQIAIPNSAFYIWFGEWKNEAQSKLKYPLKMINVRSLLFLPPFYEATTCRCLPAVGFPSDWHHLQCKSLVYTHICYVIWLYTQHSNTHEDDNHAITSIYFKVSTMPAAWNSLANMLGLDDKYIVVSVDNPLCCDTVVATDVINLNIIFHPLS